jgi:hypothetical protein
VSHLTLRGTRGRGQVGVGSFAVGREGCLVLDRPCLFPSLKSLYFISKI